MLGKIVYNWPIPADLTLSVLREQLESIAVGIYNPSLSNTTVHCQVVLAHSFQLN